MLDGARATGRVMQRRVGGVLRLQAVLLDSGSRKGLTGKVTFEQRV